MTVYEKCKKIIKKFNIGIDPDECNLEIALAMKETDNSENEKVLAVSLYKHLKDNLSDHYATP
jgi:hypothetical protein